MRACERGHHGYRQSRRIYAWLHGSHAHGSDRTDGHRHNLSYPQAHITPLRRGFLLSAFFGPHMQFISCDSSLGDDDAHDEAGKVAAQAPLFQKPPFLFQLFQFNGTS